MEVADHVDRPPPLRPITDDEIRTFWADGAVCIRGVLDPAWLQTLLEPIDHILSSAHATDFTAQVMAVRATRGTLGTRVDDEFLEDAVQDGATGTGRYGHALDSWRADRAIGRFATESMLPEIAGRVLRASFVNLYVDQLLVKEPGTPTRTAFHVDEPYFSVVGDRVCTCWVPLDTVTVASGAMGYVKGSHRWGKNYLPNSFVTGLPRGTPSDALEQLPDIDRHQDDFDVVYYECEPGDLTIHHYRTAHGSGGNTTPDRRRRALAIRYCGEDVRYQSKVTAPVDNSDGLLTDGDRLGKAPVFPECWRRPDEMRGGH